MCHRRAGLRPVLVVRHPGGTGMGIFRRGAGRRAVGPADASRRSLSAVRTIDARLDTRLRRAVVGDIQQHDSLVGDRAGVLS